MQNVAANLGGMLTPFGNPQNLYLYSYYSIAAGEFFKIMALPFAVAFLLIAVTCLFVKPVHVELETPETAAPPAWRMIVYFVLFALSVLIVFRVFPFYVGLIVVTVALLILEPKAFLHVDYALLLTFCAFFVFSGNLARIPAVEQTLGSLVALSPLLVGTASCQVISNVPSAVLLSRFTTDYRHLLVAVNIGGLGTPVSSLASLITLGEYRKREPGKTGRYLALFSDRTRGVTAHAQPPPQRREDTFLAAAVRRMTRRTSLFSPPAPLKAPSHDDTTSRALAAPLPRIPRRAQMFSKIPATCRNSVDKAPAKTYNHIAFSARRPKCCYGSVGRAHPW